MIAVCVCVWGVDGGRKEGREREGGGGVCRARKYPLDSP